MNDEPPPPGQPSQGQPPQGRLARLWKAAELRNVPLRTIVVTVAVVGLPHERWGEAVTAIVVPDPAAPPDAAELIAFCRGRLAGFETPKQVIFTDGLPETVGGKVLKYKLRVQHAGHYRDVDQ